MSQKPSLVNSGDSEAQYREVNPGSGARSKGNQKVRDWLLVSPLVIILGLLTLAPVIFVGLGAFVEGRVGSPDATWSLENLHRVYVSGEFLGPILNTLILCISVATISVFFGAVFAWLVARTDLPGKRFCEVMVISPLMLSPFVIGFAWLVLGSPRSGLINALYNQWTGSTSGLFDITSVLGTVLVMATANISYAYFFIVASLRNVDSSLEDASRMNGANELRTLVKITLPLIKPAIFASFIFIFVVVAGAFAVPALYGQISGFTVMSYVVYLRTAIWGDYGLAASAATFVVILTVLGLYLYRRVVASADKFVTLSTRSTAPSLVKLGSWKLPAFLAVVGYGLVAVVLPFISLVLVSLIRYVRPDTLNFESMSWDVFGNIFSSSLFWSAMKNTLVVMLFAPLATVILALAVTMVTQRSRLPLRNVIDYLATVPLAIPGVIFGLGFLWATIRLPIYGTVFLLIVAYTGRYIPEVNRITSAAVLQIDKGLEESSALCGASAWYTARRVVAPLLKPAIFSGFAVASIFVLREVPVAVMLTTPQTTLLSVYTWNFAYIGDFGPAAALALVQVLLYFLILFLARVVLKVDIGPGRRSGRRRSEKTAESTPDPVFITHS